MCYLLLACALVLPPVQTYSGRLGPGFDDNVPLEFITRIGLGDIDSDGRTDVLLRSASGEFTVQRNVGFGRFQELPTSVPEPSKTPGATQLEVGDVNGDGWLDLCLARATDSPTGPGVTEVLLGNGAGGFALTAAFLNDFPFDQAAADLELVDLDGNGNLDVIQSSFGVVRVHRNLGSGQFDTAGAVLYAHPTNFPVGLGSFDLGADGDLDLVLLLPDSPSFVLEQVTPQSYVPTGDLGTAFGSPFVADLDGDGLEDVVISGFDAVPAGSGQLRVYQQIGSGLVLSQTLGFPNPVAISGIGDDTGDGQPDLVVSRFVDGATSWLPGLPGVQFDPAGAIPFSVEDLPIRDLVFADLDDDGDRDAVGESEEYGARAPRLFLGLGDGRVARVGIGPEVAVKLRDQRSVADMDGDGALDLVDLDPGDIPLLAGDGIGQLFRSNGLGSLIGEVRPDYVVPLGFIDYDLGDLDGDGDVDAMVGTVTVVGVFGTQLLPARNLVMLNDGAGGLQSDPALQLATPDASAFVLLFDAQGDGDLDAFLGNASLTVQAGGENRLVLNNGTGLFTDATSNLPTERASSREGEAADFDQDGDLDLLISDRSIVPTPLSLVQPRLWINDGSGNFTDASDQLPPAEVAFPDFLIADLDQDGDLDAFLSTPQQPQLRPEWLLINDGSANFSLGALPAGLEPSIGVAFSDVDLDGDPDLVRYRDRTLTVFRNTGGVLQAKEDLGGPSIPLGGELAVLDLDGDGDEDLIVGRTPVRSLLTEVWNTSPTSLGKEFFFELRGPGPGSGFLLGYSTGLIALELPGIGLLRLDVTGPSGILGTGVLNAEGAGQVSGTIPSNPALAGLTVYVQALLGAPAQMSRAFGTTLEVF